jgi:tRNA(Arg) A34 adenosine deaminase TadA
MDQKFLQLALEQAKLSMEKGGFPAGSVIVKNREVIGTGISIGNILHDPTSHGEINAIRNACQNIFSSDLSECIIYSSLEPCLMCLNACSWANLPKVVYACGKDLTNPLFMGGLSSCLFF